jgi:hypothetical protein
MLLKDLIVTPIVLLMVFTVAYLVKSKINEPFFKKVFIPAISVKIISAIALGLIYQFYYNGGDTFLYFNQSEIIQEAFFNNPLTGLKLIFSSGSYEADTFIYSSKLKWFQFPTEFMVVKIVALSGLLCFNTYSSIAVFFAVFSFIGSWLMYRTFVKIKPTLKAEFALATFFIPSLFFWGSGILKESLMIGCLGFLFYAFYNLFISRKSILLSISLIVLSLFILYTIRIYILLGFIPPALLWIFMANNKKISNPVFRRLAAPLSFIMGLFFAYILAVNITKGNSKYDIDQIAKRTKINSEYLYNVSIAQEGSAYYLGELDGTFSSMFRVAPQAIFTTLYRPFIWEVKNPLMLVSAIEAMLFLLFSIYILAVVGIVRSFITIFKSPFLIFCLIFTLIIAFATGLNSFNFGTLVRYKIPILPFYTVLLFTLFSARKRK